MEDIRKDIDAAKDVLKSFRKEARNFEQNCPHTRWEEITKPGEYPTEKCINCGRIEVDLEAERRTLSTEPQSDNYYTASTS